MGAGRPHVQDDSTYRVIDEGAATSETSVNQGQIVLTGRILREDRWQNSVIFNLLLASIRKHLTRRTGKRHGILVIGGAVVEIDPSGHLFAKAGTVQYLNHLAATFDTVHFFAPAVMKKELIYSSRLDGLVLFYPLAHVDKFGVKRFRPLLSDLGRIYSVGTQTEAALEFFPSAGGLIGSSLLRAVSTRYGLYFGTDPFLSLRAIPTLANAGRQLMKRLASRVAASIADFVLMRDPRHFKKMGLRLLDRAHLSAPISALPRPTAIRLDRCQGEEIKLIYVGMFSQRKGILDLFHVVQMLSRDPYRRYHLLLVGAPEMLGPDRYTVVQLQEVCRTIGIKHLVEFCGYLDDVQALQAAYESADVFVLASRREGFPRVIEEALLYGLPVVAFNIASLSEVLRNGTNAMLVTQGDLREFANAVRRVAEDPALREMLITSGRDFIDTRFPLPVSEQHAALLAGSQPSSGQCIKRKGDAKA